MNRLTRRSLLTRLLALPLLTIAVSVIAAESSSPPAAAPSKTLSVGGHVKTPLTLTPVALRTFAPHAVDKLPMICGSGAKLGEMTGYVGVRLTDILDKAEILAPAHNDTKHMVVVATATDGYVAVFSWNELYNGATGEGVLVLYQKDHLPISDDEGRIALISTHDTRPGPRHVKWLKSLEVVRL